jgi:hypothetical protein
LPGGESASGGGGADKGGGKGFGSRTTRLEERRGRSAVPGCSGWRNDDGETAACSADPPRGPGHVQPVGDELNRLGEGQGEENSTTSFDIARVFFEYNSSANDLGVHVFLDGEDWKRLRIVNPNGRTIFEVEGKGPYRELGLTELFFEGAEPNLGDVPLEELLEQFPAGEYRRLAGRSTTSRS